MQERKNKFTVRMGQNRTIDYKSFTFSGGEVQVKITTELGFTLMEHEQQVLLFAPIKSSDDVMELLMLTDALNRWAVGMPIHLTMPYLPYARQDRVMTPGEALSLKVFCQIINSQNYASVTLWDVHSDVSMALLDRVSNRPQEHFVTKIFDHDKISPNQLVLVAPDAGAMKKIGKVASFLKCSMVRADKLRDVQTGAITETVVYSDHIGSKHFLIVDDICDGGRTFIELAKVLRPLTHGRILLYVTHGIFSQGLGPLGAKDVIDRVFCPNIMAKPDVVEHYGETKFLVRL